MRLCACAMREKALCGKQREKKMNTHTHTRRLKYFVSRKIDNECDFYFSDVNARRSEKYTRGEKKKKENNRKCNDSKLNR